MAGGWRDLLGVTMGMGSARLPTPESRTFYVLAEDRTFDVAAEVRAFDVAAEDRVFVVEAEE